MCEALCGRIDKHGVRGCADRSLLVARGWKSLRIPISLRSYSRIVGVKAILTVGRKSVAHVGEYGTREPAE